MTKCQSSAGVDVKPFECLMEEDNEICGYLNSETNLCEAEPKVEVQSEAEIKKDIQDKVDDHEYIRTQFITAKAVR